MKLFSTALEAQQRHVLPLEAQRAATQRAQLRELRRQSLRQRAVLLAEPVKYNRDVKPILADNCFGCHGAGKQKGNLRLDTYEAATAKNKKTTPDKLEFMKFDPKARKHVLYKEIKLK